MADFLNLVRRFFDFLLDEFRFNIVFEKTDPEHFGNSLVRFESPKVGINVVLDRGQVFAYLGWPTKPVEEWYDICDVITYFAPQIEIVYVFPNNLSSEESINFQVKRLAHLTMTYCVPVLNGDFSMEKEVRVIQKKRAEKFQGEMKKRYPQLRNLE